jgi:hypothetical protein
VTKFCSKKNKLEKKYYFYKKKLENIFLEKIILEIFFRCFHEGRQLFGKFGYILCKFGAKRQAIWGNFGTSSATRYLDTLYPLKTALSRRFKKCL